MDAANVESLRPRLFCWRPDDGYGVHLVYGGGRPRASTYDEDSPLATGYDSLVGWAPRAPVLGFGHTWRLRCLDRSDYSTCRANGRTGRVAQTCVSRTSGLTCVNTGRHGFRLGRNRGARRW